MHLLASEDATAAPSPAARVERALRDIIAAREASRLDEVIDRARTTLAWQDTAHVRRELRSGVARELGFALTLTGDPRGARDALLMALDMAGPDNPLVEQSRAALATLELVHGDPERARSHLDPRTAHRRACLTARARIELYEGRFQVAEQVLQEADHAPGGTPAGQALNPPATVLRCLAAIWAGRPDQARMLHDGVADAAHPLWQLTRVATLRALWAQTGDGRYLQLALASAEQLRATDAIRDYPGLGAAAAAIHAACLLFTGEVALASQTADEALAALGPPDRPCLPEWPRAAVLFDALLVARDAGDAHRRGELLSQWDSLGWSSWASRMAVVTGPRAAFATTLEDSARPARDDAASLEALAVRLLIDPRNIRLAAMRALGSATRALGVTWLAPDGAPLAHLGAQPPDSHESPETLTLPFAEPDAGRLRLFQPQRDALRALPRETVEAIGRVVTLREEEQRKLDGLSDHIARADAARRLAEERLEQVRRPGTDRVHGGRFPTVVGRSDALRQALDALSALGSARTSILLEGAPGAGRRHLAQALATASFDDPTGSARAATLDLSLTPPALHGARLEALMRAHAGGVFFVLAHGEHLADDALAALLDRLDRSPAEPLRALITLDSRADSPAARALRTALSHARVRVPGLDERLEDLPLLTDAFLREIGRRPDDLATGARALLARRVFPGHLAELRATLRTACVRAPAGTIQPEHFERAEAASDTRASFDPDAALMEGFEPAVDAYRRALVQRALDATLGHRARAADLLGLPRARFARLARDLGFAPGAAVEVPSDEGDDGETILLDADEGA
jgi:hypothetical protein